MQYLTPSLSEKGESACHDFVSSPKSLLSPPTSKKEKQSFLGIVGFWRMRVPNHSLIVSLFYQMTWKKNDFTWGSEQQRAFQQIKQEIACAVALGPVWMVQDVKNNHCTTAGEKDPA